MRSISLPVTNLLLLFFTTMVFGLGLYFDNLGLRLVAFIGIAVSIYAVVLVPMRWSVFFVFIYIGFEGFLKIISGYHPIIHVGADIMVITLCLKVLADVFLNGMKVDEYPPLSLIFALHFSWLVIVFFNPYSIGFVPSLAGSKVYITMFLLYFFGFYCTKSAKDIRFFMIPPIFVATVHMVFGIFQGFIGESSVLAIHPGYARPLQKFVGTAFRPFGLTHVPGMPSVFVAICFPFVLYFITYHRSYFLKFFLGATIPFFVLLQFLCQVRSSLFKMIIASSIFILGSMFVFSSVSARKARGLFVLISVVGLLTTYFLPILLDMSVESVVDNERAIERTLTLFEYEKVSNARRGAWDRFLIYSSEAPLGAGFSRVGAAAGAFKSANKGDRFFPVDHFFADNLWLAMLVEIGIPGMLLVSLLIVGILYYGLTSFSSVQREELKFLQLAIFSSLFAMTLGFYGAEGAIYNPESSFYWFFAGVMMRIPFLDKNCPGETAAI